MGLSTYIYIPKDVRVGDVAEAIGILAGLEPKWQHSDSSRKTRWVSVRGAKAVGIESCPSCAHIHLKSPSGKNLIDGDKNHLVMFHYEGNNKYNLLNPPSTPFWIAVGVGLCKFFGGAIDYNDCDAGGMNRHFKRPRKNNSPCDGRAWDKFQQEMMNIKPLTKANLKRAKKQAGYEMEIA